MRRTRLMRTAGHALRLLLFALIAVLAARFFWTQAMVRGDGPGTVFSLLLLAGGVALVWRGLVGFRRELRRW